MTQLRAAFSWNGVSETFAFGLPHFEILHRVHRIAHLTKASGHAPGCTEFRTVQRASPGATCPAAGRPRLRVEAERLRRSQG